MTQLNIDTSGLTAVTLCRLDINIYLDQLNSAVFFVSELLFYVTSEKRV